MTKPADCLSKTERLAQIFGCFSLQITLDLHIRNRAKLRSKFCFLYIYIYNEIFCKTSACCFLYGVSYKRELDVYYNLPGFKNSKTQENKDYIQHFLFSYPYTHVYVRSRNMTGHIKQTLKA